MASAMFEQCLLCKSDVSHGTNKVKRKKFYGSKAGKVREIIDKLLREHFQSDVSECGMHVESYICHKCIQQVEGLPQLLHRAEMEKKAVLDMLDSSIVRTRGSKLKRKRLYSDDLEETTPEVIQQSSEAPESSKDVKVSVSHIVSY